MTTAAAICAVCASEADVVEQVRRTVIQTRWITTSESATHAYASQDRESRARGRDHPHAVRILARAWLHVICRCWQDGVPYDPTKHHALQRVLNQAA